MEKKEWIGAISAMFAVHLIGCTGLMNVHIAILAIFHVALGLTFGFLVNFYYSEKNNLWFWANNFLSIIITVTGINKYSPIGANLNGYNHLVGVGMILLFYTVGHYLNKTKVIRA